MGREEKDLTKRHKLDRLQLVDDEWERLGLFNDLLGVCHVFFHSTKLSLIFTVRNSMLIKHNMHFRLTKERHFISRYLHLKCCSRHG